MAISVGAGELVLGELVTTAIVLGDQKNLSVTVHDSTVTLVNVVKFYALVQTTHKVLG